jgi:hypothetical protein
MEAAIKKALHSRGCLYKDISSPLLTQLETLASQNGLDAKGIALAFDKFMTTNRSASLCGNIVLHLIGGWGWQQRGSPDF